MTFLMWGWPVVLAESFDGNALSSCSADKVFALVTDATLDDLREAVTTLEETARLARRVLGGAHPTTRRIERDLRKARAALRGRTE